MDRISEFAKRLGVELYTEMPKGWGELKGATTAPKGSKWIYNNQSLFSGKRIVALLKEG